jgi:N-formylglutamate deformylase
MRGLSGGLQHLSKLRFAYFSRHAARWTSTGTRFAIFGMTYHIVTRSCWCWRLAVAIEPYRVFRRGRSPIVAAAIHDGHDTRPSVQKRLAISASRRLYEEDPYTGAWTQIAKTQVIGLRSRFEFDLNRPRDKAIYMTPDDAWGCGVWRRIPDETLVEQSLREYDKFYSAVETLLKTMVDDHGRTVVYDLHTYNHYRGGPGSPPGPAIENPEVNIGTGTMDREFWGPVVERFIDELRRFDFHGCHLDVRENVRFQGGYFGKWTHQTFPGQVCSIAIEVKKFFMNEWNGEANMELVERIYQALHSTLAGVEEELKRL